MQTKTKMPHSHFFTDLAFTQFSGTNVPDANAKSFGPLDENRFQITTTFKGALNAYAVKEGILLISKQAGSTDKINILLKPTNEIGLGVKIKYFVYRGINASDFFKNISGTVLVNEASSLSFITRAWDIYNEMYGTASDLQASQIGYIDGTGGVTKEILKKYFNKDNYNLLKVNAGSPLGKFALDAGGFEIVLDEGDYSQDKSDTGLDFDLSFIMASGTVLNTNKDAGHPNLPTEFGTQINSVINSKIFKENIYKFLDPAAFYGSHVIDNSANPVNKGRISIGGSNTSYSSMNDIYINIVKKFKNRYKTYFYVRGDSNRNLNFYDTANMLKVNGTAQDLNASNWPILIISSSFCNIEFTNNAFNNPFYSSTYLSATNANSIPKEGYLFAKTEGVYVCNLPFYYDSGNRVFSSITYLSFNNSLINKYEYLFGPINLASIFEREDYTSKHGATVNHLRKVLIRQTENVAYYNTKVVLEGYIADSNPQTIPTDPAILAKTLRTYILFPQEATTELSDGNINFNAGYFPSVNNSNEYCSKLYGRGEIWKGKIYDGEDINALLYRRKDNDENNLPIYQLGISQPDYKKLTADVYNIDNEATNLFFCFENEFIDPNGAFLRYDLKIKFDKRDGTRANTTQKVSVYTIDSHFFFTKTYANNFAYYNEFANISVDFLPQDLSTVITGYETAGFDYVGFNAGSTSYTNRTLYKNLLGKYYNATTGKLENLDTDNPSNYTFKTNREFFHTLLHQKYNSKPTNWRKNANDFPFHTDSFITLYPNKETVVKLKFTRGNPPPNSKLYIKYNKKYIAINEPLATPSPTDQLGTFEIPLTNYEPSINENYTITVKSLQISEIDQPIEVYAVEGTKELLAGKCWLRSNKNRYKIKVVLVNCITKLSTTAAIKNGLPSSQIDLTKKIIKTFLNQILIEPDFEVVDLDLDKNSLGASIPEFKKGGAFIVNNVSGTGNEGVHSSKEMFDFCINLLPTAQKGKCTLLFFNEYGDTDSLGGEAYKLGGAEGARIFSPGLQKTSIAHELLHSIGLEHSFDNNSEFTFQIYQTDNIMDYKNFAQPDSKRKLIWIWQDKKVKRTNNNNKLIP